MKNATFNHEKLKAQRQLLEYSRLDVVKRLYEHALDISEVTLESWEAGRTTPDADVLPKLADVLHLKVHEFYE